MYRKRELATNGEITTIPTKDGIYIACRKTNKISVYVPYCDLGGGVLGNTNTNMMNMLFY